MNKFFPKQKSDIQITVLAVLACLLWSTAFVALKIGLKYSSPLYFAGIRFMISGIVLLPFCGNISDFFNTVTKNFKKILILAFIQIFILYGILFYAMTFTPSALAAITIGSSPLITAIVSHFMMHDDKMSRSKTLSLFIGIAGVVILSISRKPWTFSGLKEFIGIIMLLVGSTASALGNVIVAKDKEVDPLILNTSQIFIGGCLLFILSIPVEGVPVLITSIDFYLALAWLVFVSSTAFSTWFILLSTPGVKVSELNVWKFIIPICGAILSWMILPDESPELFPIMGMVIIALSIVIYNRSASGK